MTKSYLTPEREQKILPELAKVISRAGEGLCKYEPGCNDRQLARQLGFSVANIRTVRKTHFGVVKVALTDEERVERLEKKNMEKTLRRANGMTRDTSEHAMAARLTVQDLALAKLADRILVLEEALERYTKP